MNANDFLGYLQSECKKHVDCADCIFFSQEDGVTHCKIVDVAHGLNPLDVEFSGDHPEANRIKREVPTINIKNVYICERKNDG